ncbi:MAG TPA: GDP-mannose 4,6-dehydratase [Candidatus Poseidoniaceae archaeon]|nr:GDP-mannose 4,6-dehydratase [Candidatus Poseidoniaceae archaeon]
MAKVLVTGGTGFIGAVCSRIFLDKGWSVHVLDRRPPDFNLTLHNHNKFSFQQGDICVVEDVEKAIHGCDAVVHLAAQISVPKSFEDPDKNHQVNVIGTQNILVASLNHNISSFISASSAAVYGDSKQLPLSEADAGSCLSPYAESKWENERQIRAYRENGLNAIALRFFNVYGPGQEASGGYASVIPKFIRMMSDGDAPTIYGDGSQTRDFIHAADVCEAIFQLIELQQPFKHDVVNVCSQTEYSIQELIDLINRCLVDNDLAEKPLKSISKNIRIGDIRRSCGNNKRLKTMINWDVKVDFEDGVFELINQYSQG